MKLYRVIATAGGDCKSKWVGSQADAGKARKEFVEDGFKRADLTTEEHEFATNKEGLINFLNGLDD